MKLDLRASGDGEYRLEEFAARSAWQGRRSVPDYSVESALLYQTCGLYTSKVLPRDGVRSRCVLDREVVYTAESNRYGWNVDERFLHLSRGRRNSVTRLLDAYVSSH